MKNKHEKLFLPLLTAMILLPVLSGCIRVKAGAGYAYQGKEDEVPQTKSVGFDTQDIVDPDRPKGNITV